MPDPTLTGIEETPTGVRLRVYVTPRSSANTIVGVHGDELKIALAAPPVDGAANRALLEYLAKKLGVPKSAARLLSGESSRHKVVSIDRVSKTEVEEKLGLL